MATLSPFAPLRPDPALAGEICELPYDVMSSEEARALAGARPLSFLHVSKPEIDFPPGQDPHAPEVYETGRRNFLRLRAEGALRQDAAPCYHLYRQIMGPHSQTGLVALASCDEYLRGMVKKHELTRPDKEDDRVRHIETLEAQTGPVFLTYRADPAIDERVARLTAGAPEIDFTAPDGVRHSSWPVTGAADIAFLQARIEALPALYIADGHHRSAAAARVFQARAGAGASGGFLSVTFPHDQLRILPYNRVLRDLNGHDERSLLEALARVFVIEEAGRPAPAAKHEIGFLLDGRWRTLRFRPEFTAAGPAVDLLDVALLQEHILAPVFGIDNPRTSERIAFVGGIRGTGELESMAARGGWACAFSMFPTSLEDLMEVADAGGIMPPKSTWFEPKLRDALFSHLI